MPQDTMDLQSIKELKEGQCGCTVRGRPAQNDVRQNGTYRASEDLVLLLTAKETLTHDGEDITIIFHTSENSFRALKLFIYSPQFLGGLQSEDPD